MNCKELDLTLEQEGLEPLPEAARAHVTECPACRTSVNDFLAIVSAAERIPAEAEPPERLWISLRSQLEAEDVIRKPAPAETISWWQRISAAFQRPAVAMATAGLVVLAVVGIQFVSGPRPRPDRVPPVPSPFADTQAVLKSQEESMAHIALASTVNSPVDASLNDNLQIVDKFIADCEERIRQVPEDEIARDYLSGAYQQKADLLSAIMDRRGGGD